MRNKYRKIDKNKGNPDTKSARVDKRRLETQESDPDAKHCCISGSKLITYNLLEETNLLFPDGLFLTKLYSPLPFPLFVQSILEKIVINSHRIPSKKHTVVKTKSTVYIWNIDTITLEFGIKKEKELDFGLYLEATDAFFKFQCKHAADNVIITHWSKHFKCDKKKLNSAENYHSWKGLEYKMHPKLLVYFFDFNQGMYDTSYNNAMQDYKNEIRIQEAIAQALTSQVSAKYIPSHVLGAPCPSPFKNQIAGGSFQSNPTCLICSESGHTIQGHPRIKPGSLTGNPPGPGTRETGSSLLKGGKSAFPSILDPTSWQTNVATKCQDSTFPPFVGQNLTTCCHSLAEVARRRDEFITTSRLLALTFPDFSSFIHHCPLFDPALHNLLNTFSTISTPYNADAFEFLLRKYNLTTLYPHLVHNLCNSFPLGVTPEI